MNDTRYVKPKMADTKAELILMANQFRDSLIEAKKIQRNQLNGLQLHEEKATNLYAEINRLQTRRSNAVLEDSKIIQELKANIKDHEETDVSNVMAFMELQTKYCIALEQCLKYTGHAMPKADFGDDDEKIGSWI